MSDIINISDFAKKKEQENLKAQGFEHVQNVSVVDILSKLGIADKIRIYTPDELDNYFNSLADRGLELVVPTDKIQFADILAQYYLYRDVADKIYYYKKEECISRNAIFVRLIPIFKDISQEKLDKLEKTTPNQQEPDQLETPKQTPSLYIENIQYNLNTSNTVTTIPVLLSDSIAFSVLNYLAEKGVMNPFFYEE